MQLKRPLVYIPAAIAILALAAFLLLWLGARTPFGRRVAGDWVAQATGLPAGQTPGETASSLTRQQRARGSPVKQMLP